jgi:hypothetical protein
MFEPQLHGRPRSRVAPPWSSTFEVPRYRMEIADLPRHFWFSSNTESRPRIHSIELIYIGVAGKAILTLEPKQLL